MKCCSEVIGDTSMNVSGILGQERCTSGKMYSHRFTVIRLMSAEYAAEDLSLPPGYEIIVPARVVFSSIYQPLTEWACDTRVIGKGIVAARTLIDDKSTNMVIWVANLENKEGRLPKDTLLVLEEPVTVLGEESDAGELNPSSFEEPGSSQYSRGWGANGPIAALASCGNSSPRLPREAGRRLSTSKYNEAYPLLWSDSRIQWKPIPESVRSLADVKARRVSGTTLERDEWHHISASLNIFRKI